MSHRDRDSHPDFSGEPSASGNPADGRENHNDPANRAPMPKPGSEPQGQSPVPAREVPGEPVLQGREGSQGEAPPARGNHGPESDTPEFYQTLTEAQLMDLWRTQQDKLATAEVWRRYQEKLIERGHRSRGGEFTEESVQISAFASVLRMGRERVFNTDRDDWLWRLLATISANKLATRHRKRREATGDLFDDLPVPMSLDPGPDEIAMYNEQRQRLMEVLTKREREYFECREEGMKQVDIAKYWQRDVKTVYRVGIAVQQKAARLFRGDIQGDGVVS